MKTKKILASLLASVVTVASVTTLASCKKNDNPKDDEPTIEPSENNEDKKIVQAAIDKLAVDAEATGDFTLIIKGNGNVAITWTSSNTEVIAIDGSNATVKRPAIGQADVVVKLTATAVLNDEQMTKEFTVTVKAVQDDSITIAAAKQTAKGEKVIVRGIVSGFIYAENTITDKSGFIITDDTGSIYVFGKNVATDLKVGDDVYFSATTDVYYGSPQLKFPENVSKLGENQTPNFATIITDKTVTDLVEEPNPGSETTNQGKVYELLAYFNKISTDTYVNYKVCDPYNKNNGLNVYFKSTIVPGQNYPWTAEYDSYAGKYCKIKFYMTGTSSSGAWRGNILGFTALTEAENAEVTAKSEVYEELNRLVGLFDNNYDAEAEINLSASEGYTVTVTPQENANTLAFNNNILTITPQLTETTENVTIKVVKGEVELTKVIAVKSKLFVPTVGSYSATMKYSGQTANMKENQNNATLVGLRASLFDIVTENGTPAIGLNKDGSIRLYKSNRLIINAQGLGDLKLVIKKITITYGAGKNNPTFTVNGAAGATTTTEYVINGSSVTIENTSSDGQLWISSLVIDYEISEATDLDKAQIEANRLAGLVSSSYDENSAIDLIANENYTLVVTPQANAKALSFAENTLAITQQNNDVTEELTISVTYNGQTYTKTLTIFVKGLAPTDITSKVTITDGVINIPYDAITDDGKYIIKLDETKSIIIEYDGFVDQTKYKEFGLQGKKAIKITSIGFKLSALASDVYGTYDNMKCYVGTDATGTAVTAGKNKFVGSGVTYLYEFTEAANDIYFENTSDKTVSFYSFKIIAEDSLDKFKTDSEVAVAEKELNRLVALFANKFDKNTEVDLTSTVGTVTVTIQEATEILSWNAETNKLTINPSTTLATGKITISVKVGSTTKTKENIEVKSQINEKQSTVVIGEYATANNWVNDKKYESLSIDTSTTIAIVATGNSGKYYTNGNEWRVYQNENPTITISSTKTIVSVTIYYTVKNTGVLINGENNITSGTELQVNGTSVSFNVGNTGTAKNGQVKITKIVVNYA